MDNDLRQQIARAQKEAREFNNENLQDVMIRATRTYNIDKEKILDVFHEQGITGVFNLGLETMYRYLNNTKLN